MADKTDLKEAPAREEVQVAQDPALRKVELDLDDAPFLKEQEPDVPAVAKGDAQPAPVSAPPASQKKKKLLVLGGAALVLLLLGGAAAWWFLLRTPPPPPLEAKPEVIVVPSQPAQTAAVDQVKELAPFVVPRQSAKGMRFLVCKFSTISKSPRTSREIDQKLIPLRDALYYYLSSKNDSYLLDPANVSAIKKDLVGVLNDYLSQGRIEDIVFESYLND